MHRQVGEKVKTVSFSLQLSNQLRKHLTLHKQTLRHRNIEKVVGPYLYLTLGIDTNVCFSCRATQEVSL